MKWCWTFSAAVLLFLGSLRALGAATAPGPEISAAAVNQWEADIAALEARNQTESHPADSILFVGSSSFRLWETINTDMAPYHPIQRGFGGSRFSDLAVFARRLIAPHRFRALVLFAANDVTGKPDDPGPEQVAGWFGHVVETTRATHPDALIFCLAVTPTPARWDAWPRIREVNRALALECAAWTNVHFLPTAHAYLGANGQPMDDLFLEDRLHQSALGYRIWSAIIKSHLDAALGSDLKY
jgi:lysophospholipase L1-like esterase